MLEVAVRKAPLCDAELPVASLGSSFLILTSRNIFLAVRGRVHTTCVRRSAKLQCWAPITNDLSRLRQNDRAMIRWICNVKIKDRINSSTLAKKLRVNTIYVPDDSDGMVMCKERLVERLF